MNLAIFSLRGAAAFRNQSALLYKAAVHAGLECEERDIEDRVHFPKDRWDRVIVLAPLWPRYTFDAVRLSTPWITRNFTLYGPVDGPYSLNITFTKVIKQMRVITVSQFCKECMERSGIRVDGVVPHGIDPADFQFSEAPQYGRFNRLREEHPGKTIFFSNLSSRERKGFKHLARALQILQKERPDAWIFVLHADRTEALKYAPDLAGISNLKIEDAYNKLPFRQIALKTASCDVFVFPSLLEGFGLPVLEAMAAKRPIVCCDIPPLNELVNDRQAWLFPFQTIREKVLKRPGCVAPLHEYDPADLAATMATAMDQPKESSEKAEAAFRKSKKYHYLKVYTPLVTG